MFEPKWYNTELKDIQASIFKDFLHSHGIRFEASGCYNLIHFEIFITNQHDLNSIECFLILLPD